MTGRVTIALLSWRRRREHDYIYIYIYAVHYKYELQVFISFVRADVTLQGRLGIEQTFLQGKISQVILIIPRVAHAACSGILAASL